MPNIQTCIVAARGSITVRPGGVPAGPGEVVIGVDIAANARALERGDLKPFDGEVPQDALDVTPSPVFETDHEPAPLDLTALTVVLLRELAADRGVDLGRARKKPDIIAALEAAITTPNPGETP